MAVTITFKFQESADFVKDLSLKVKRIQYSALVCIVSHRIDYLKTTYFRIAKVAGPITFGISRPKGPQLSGSRHFRAVKCVSLKNKFIDRDTDCDI